MNRAKNWFGGFVLVMTPLAFGQDPQPTPQYPDNALASQQLVAWSRLQKPQPAPQPLPPRDTPIPQPDQPGQQSKQPATPQDQEQTPAQTFTGKIVKDGGKYILKVASDIAYQLDAQSDVAQYENHQVKVIGSLDTGSNTIRIVKIELLS